MRLEIGRLRPVGYWYSGAGTEGLWMNDVERTVEAALCKLIGKPLVSVGRAADMLTLQIGELRQRKIPLGGSVETGDWSLNIQFAWRITGPQGIYTGRSDYWQPSKTIDPVAIDSRWNPENGNLRDERLSAWIISRQASPVTLQSFVSDRCGAISLRFDDGFTLEIFPDSTQDEDWRLIEWEGNGHLVVTGGKPEYETQTR